MPYLGATAQPPRRKRKNGTFTRHSFLRIETPVRRQPLSENTAVMNNILVPTDFSAHAQAAFETAVSIARRTGALVHLYHVMDIPDIPGMREIMARRNPAGSEASETADSALHQLVRSETYRDIGASCSIDYGTPWKAITGKAEGDGFDLVVIGSHGMKRLEKIVFGSTTEQVIRHSICPVLTVQDTLCCFSPASIVLGAERSRENTCCIDAARSFASHYNATMHLVKVSTPDHFINTRQARMEMEFLARENGIGEYSVNCYNDESMQEGLLHFAEDIGADLLCMTTRVTSELARLYRTTMGRNTTTEVAIPILTCRVPEA